MPASAAAPMCDGLTPSGGGWPANLSRFSARGLSLLLGGALILWGCADPPRPVDGGAAQPAAPAGGEEVRPTFEITVPADVAKLPDYASLDPGDDPRRLLSKCLGGWPVWVWGVCSAGRDVAGGVGGVGVGGCGVRRWPSRCCFGGVRGWRGVGG